MTPTLESMRAAVKALKDANLLAGFVVTIGGPPTAGGFAEEIGADHRDDDAQSCVSWMHEKV